MMHKLKHWLYHKFLPAWCREDLMETNQHLADTAEAQRQEIQQLQAYIRGMEQALRLQKRAVRCGGEKPCAF